MANLLTIWKFLILVRIILTLKPQTGYIHPDEFFQTVEALSGDMLEIQTERPWEFTTISPIRSYTITHAILGLPLWIFNSIRQNVESVRNDYCFSDQPEGIVGKVSSSVIGKADDTTYLSYKACNLVHLWEEYESVVLLVLPRIAMLLLSFLVDYCLYKCCKVSKKDHVIPLLILASSNVILTYQCRTLTNSLETVLFGLLLLQTLKSLHYYDDELEIEQSNKNAILNGSNKMKDHPALAELNRPHGRIFATIPNGNKSAEQRGDEAGGDRMTYIPVRDSRFKRRRASLSILPEVPYGHAMGMILALGVFNRPTFLAYSFIPCLIWLLLYKPNGIGKQLAFHVTWRALSLLIPACFSGFILILGDSLYYGRIEISHLTNPTELPWDNLVITPLNFLRYNANVNNLAKHGLHYFFLHFLVNVPLLFGLLGILGLYKCVRLAFSSRSTGPNNDDIYMNTSWFFPVLFFTFFPHQEPRFLIPCVIPLAFVSYEVLFLNRSKFIKIKIIHFWIISNLICTLWFGFLHQAGVLPSLFFLQGEIKTQAETDNAVNVIFFHTYMPPRHLLLMPRPTYGIRFSSKKLPAANVVDLSGSPVVELQRRLHALHQNGCCSKTYVVMPQSIVPEVEALVTSYQLEEVFRWGWHFSFEDPPFRKGAAECFEQKESPKKGGFSVWGSWEALKNAASCLHKEYVDNIGLVTFNVQSVTTKATYDATKLMYKMR